MAQDPRLPDGYDQDDIDLRYDMMAEGTLPYPSESRDDHQARKLAMSEHGAGGAAGDIWNVPPYSHEEFSGIAPDVFREAEGLLGGWPGKCRSACSLARVPFRPGWLGVTTGMLANELGAPVGQALRVVALRRLRA